MEIIMHAYLTIFIVFCALYFLVPQKYVGWLFFALVVALSVMAFNCVPKETDDLARYYVQLGKLRRGNWDTFQIMLHDNDNNWGSLPVCGYYFYFISKLQNNGFLPGITIFLAYGAMLLIVYRVSVRFNVSKENLFLATAFLLTTYWFYDICSGIRNGLAFTIFVLCVYYDVSEKKNRLLCYIGYFLCIGLHSSVIILVILRLSLSVIQKYGEKLMSVVMMISIAVGGNFLQWLGSVSDNRYLRLLAEKAEGNEFGRMSETVNTYFYVNTSVFLVVALLSVFLFQYIKKSKIYLEIKSFTKFYTLVMFFIAGSVFSQLIYIRMIRWIVPILGSVIFMVGMQTFKEKRSASEELKTAAGVKSIIKNRESMMETNELIINLCFIAYTGVHLWYTCNGSSLIWLHFKALG